MGKRGPKPKPRLPYRLAELSDVEQRFVEVLKREGKTVLTLDRYVYLIRRFVQHVGDAPLDRLTEEQVRSFFTLYRGMTASTRRQYSMIISRFLQVAAAGLPVPVNALGSETAPRRPATKKELALRQQWLMEKLTDDKEKADDLIAQLARKVIDHFLYFQGRMKGEPENLDEIYRFAAECEDLIQRNLALFMGLSAGGRNVHPKLDERVQR